MAEIVFINEKRGMAVVEVESNICSVIEILDSVELVVGERVSGDFNKLGSTKMNSLDSFEEVDIIVQNILLSKNQAITRAYLQ
jgi:hypothetical protein